MSFGDPAWNAQQRAMAQANSAMNPYTGPQLSSATRGFLTGLPFLNQAGGTPMPPMTDQSAMAQGNAEMVRSGLGLPPGQAPAMSGPLGASAPNLTPPPPGQSNLSSIFNRATPTMRQFGNPYGGFGGFGGGYGSPYGSPYGGGFGGGFGSPYGSPYGSGFGSPYGGGFGSPYGGGFGGGFGSPYGGFGSPFGGFGGGSPFLMGGFGSPFGGFGNQYGGFRSGQEYMA